MTSTADSVEDIPSASTMDSSYSIGLTLTSGAPVTVDYGSDYEHAPVHSALPQGEDQASDLQNHFDDSSDDETTACMSSSSDSTVVIPINLDHHQRQFPEKSENGALVAPMHSISMTHLNVNAPPMSFSLDSKSETNSVFYDICKICHQTSDPEDPLISPCRCAGTLQYIHGTCLTRWLEILSKKSRKPPKCELCNFQYNRHKKFKFHHWRFPRISRHDKVLHIVFIINLMMMISCAIATVMCFLSDKGQITKFPRNRADLTTEEIITLSCGVLFFVSFFIAMSVQIKAKHTVYQLLVKFVTQNMEWEIDAYDESKDAEVIKKFKSPPVPV